jgi:hypothetical protein
MGDFGRAARCVSKQFGGRRNTSNLKAGRSWLGELLRRRLRGDGELFFAGGSWGGICILWRRGVEVAQAVFRRVRPHLRWARTSSGWVIALGSGRFGRVLRIDGWMLVRRLLGLLILGRHMATSPVLPFIWRCHEGLQLPACPGRHEGKSEGLRQLVSQQYETDSDWSR